MKLFIPCQHFSIQSCTCLSTNEKNDSNTILRYHWQTSDCLNPNHVFFNKHGYYQVKKPIWKSSCSCPYAFNDVFLNQLEQICHLSGLKCECTTLFYCTLCRSMDDIFTYAEEEKASELTRDVNKDYNEWYNVFTELRRYLYFDTCKKKKLQTKS